MATKYICPPNCPDRRGGVDNCHTTCKTYIEGKAENDRKRAEQQKAKQLENLVYETQLALIRRTKKRNHDRRRK